MLRSGGEGVTCREFSEIFNNFRSLLVTHEGTEGKLLGGCGLWNRCARGMVLRIGVRKHITV